MSQHMQFEVHRVPSPCMAYGRVDVWAYGCVGVWVYGYMVYGCMCVCVHGCTILLRESRELLWTFVRFIRVQRTTATALYLLRGSRSVRCHSHPRMWCRRLKIRCTKGCSTYGLPAMFTYMHAVR